MVPTSPLEAMAQWGRMVALAPSLTLEGIQVLGTLRFKISMELFPFAFSIHAETLTPSIQVHRIVSGTIIPVCYP